MMLAPLNSLEKKIFKQIKNFDTPSISNALELIDPALRSKGHTQKTMHCSNPLLKPIVGFAKTAVITSRKKRNTNIIKNRDKYYEYMYDGDYPKICVVEDRDKHNTIGAWWGELNVSIHSNFGFVGAIKKNQKKSRSARKASFWKPQTSLSALEKNSDGFDFSEGSVLQLHLVGSIVCRYI